MKTCLNCRLPLEAEDKFCSACGQKTSATRLTMKENAHDIVHAVTHAEHSIFALVRSLITQPGYVAREYVEGRRKRHFGPWAFLVITIGIASAVILLSGMQWFAPFGHGKAGELLQRHVNLVILIQMPLLAVFCWLLFRRSGLYFAEHLVLAAYTTGLHALFIAAVETPLLALTHAQTADPRIAALYTGVWTVYFAFAASQFHAANRVLSFVKGLVVVALSQVASVGVIMATLYLLSMFQR